MEIIPVLTKSDILWFNEVPRRINLENEAFISYLDSDIDKVFDKTLNEYYTAGNAMRWILKDNDDLIGRIAAFYNNVKNHCGIGFFECVNNLEASKLLFTVAEDWLKSKNVDRIEAPVNFGERDKYYGLLITSSSTASFQENVNPAYYQHLFELNNYTAAFEQTTSEISIDNFDPRPFKTISKRLLNSNEYRIKYYKANQSQKFAEDFCEVYNASWSSHAHFIPVNSDRVRSLFRQMKPIMVDKLICFAYHKDKPIGFFISVLEINALLKPYNGQLSLFNKLELWLQIRRHKIEKAKGLVFGVLPSYQGKGIIALMIYQCYLELLKMPYIKKMELSWIGDFNPLMHSLFKRLGAKKTKLHITYEKHLK